MSTIYKAKLNICKLNLLIVYSLLFDPLLLRLQLPPTKLQLLQLLILALTLLCAWFQLGTRARNLSTDQYSTSYNRLYQHKCIYHRKLQEDFLDQLLPRVLSNKNRSVNLSFSKFFHLQRLYRHPKLFWKWNHSEEHTWIPYSRGSCRSSILKQSWAVLRHSNPKNNHLDQ